jgi:hypothetical protein
MRELGGHVPESTVFCIHERRQAYRRIAENQSRWLRQAVVRMALVCCSPFCSKVRSCKEAHDQVISSHIESFPVARDIAERLDDVIGGRA